MRYADGGGLTAQGRSRREQVRLQAAEMFEHDADARQVAGSLRVSTKSVYQWRRAWRAGGEGALASKGAGGSPCKLDEDQLAQLRAALEAAPAATGGSRTSGGPWPGSPRWSSGCPVFLTRCAGCRSCCTGSGTARRSPRTAPSSATRTRSPSGGRRPGRRYEASGAGRRVDLLRGRGRAGTRPDKARTWAPRGHTPVMRVSGNTGRLSVAGMACLKAGRPGRFFYRVRVHRRRKGERPSLSEADYAHLVTAAHRALDAPVIVIWDNLNTHRSRKMRAFTQARESWLTVVQLPGYAPGLNAVEGACSAMKSGLGNHAAATLDQLEAIVRTRLRNIQRRPDLINALLGQTGLTLDPQPP